MRSRPPSPKEETRARLSRVDPERLADSLLRLAEQSDEAADLVGGLTATSEQRVQRFKQKLAALKHRRRFVPRGESSSYARSLTSMLEDLQAGGPDARTGIELVASFFECDTEIFEHSDDSDGTIGDVFRLDARDLFVHFAAPCEDKAWLAERVLELLRDDDYGVRDSVVEAAGRFLPEREMRVLAERMWKASEGAPTKSPATGTRDYRRFRWLGLVEVLARQLRDPVLFEKARRTRHPEIGTAARIDIARVHFESGDAGAALSWLEQIPEGETFQEYERDQLLQAVQGKLGNRKAVEELAWKKFQRHRGTDTLASLLSVIGESRREAVVEQAVAAILDEKSLSETDAGFLIETGHLEEAERYVLARREELNGDFYSSLLPLAEGFEAERRFLAASVIYRSLIESVLRRAVSKYYPHAVRYLRHLDHLAGDVMDWRDVASHAEFVTSLWAMHARKAAFWGRYEK
jgi:hypothetical protein